MCNKSVLNNTHNKSHTSVSKSQWNLWKWELYVYTTGSHVMYNFNSFVCRLPQRNNKFNYTGRRATHCGHNTIYGSLLCLQIACSHSFSITHFSATSVSIFHILLKKLNSPKSNLRQRKEIGELRHFILHLRPRRSPGSARSSVWQR